MTIVLSMRAGGTRRYRALRRSRRRRLASARSRSTRPHAEFTIGCHTPTRGSSRGRTFGPRVRYLGAALSLRVDRRFWRGQRRIVRRRLESSGLLRVTPRWLRPVALWVPTVLMIHDDGAAVGCHGLSWR